MGAVELLTVSLPSTTAQWERLSSSHQASTRGATELSGVDTRSFNLSTISCRSTRLFTQTCKNQRNHVSGVRINSWSGPCPKKNSLDTKCTQGSSYHSFRIPKQSSGRYSSSSAAAITSQTQDAFSKYFTENENIGVLLLNLGGPETLDDVQPFLFNLFSDPDIIRLPRIFRFLQKPLAQFVSVLRAPKSKEGYASIGGGSPLRKITDAQVNVLKN